MTGSVVACVGAGNVGRAWAIVFARAGHRVKLFDADSASLRERTLPLIARHLDDLQSFDLIEDAATVLARIEPAQSLREALQEAEHVQESAWENIDAKRELFGQLDALAPADAIIASSTSAIMPSAFLERIPGRARCLVAHPVNPPYLIPLVELCGSAWTCASTIDRCHAFMIACGQKPIRVQREIEGFILNRLQFALVGEALHLVGEGYCSVEDVDEVLTAGLARRWAFIGPFATAHLNSTTGYRGFMQGLGGMVRSVTRDLHVAYDWDAALVERIHARLAAHTPDDRVTERQAWRDRRLMAIGRMLAELHDEQRDRGERA